MAPVYASLAPSSRRTRRRQQRHRQRCCRQQQLSEQFWKQTNNNQPASQPKDWLEADLEDGTAIDTTWTQPQAADLDPSINQFTNSNSFSILDVGIPSPTLTLPKTIFTDQTHQQNTPTNPDIYRIGVSTGFSIPPLETQFSKKLRRDSWTLNIQKEGLVRSLYDPLVQDTVFHPVASVTDSSPARHDALQPLTSCSGDSSTTGSSSNFRVPSPLLYHRRSHAGCSDNADCAQHDDSHSSSHTRLMSEIRGKVQYRKQKASDITQEPIFIAAKLPLMGSAATCEAATGQDALLTTAEDPIKQSLPPFLTTTNVCLLPQKLYQIFDCGSKLTFNRPSTETSNPSWLADQILVFPTMTLSEQLPICEADRVGTNICPVFTTKSVILSSNPDPEPAHFLASRDRSSTQDSLDRNFTVKGTLLKGPLKLGDTKPWVGSESDLAKPSAQLWQDMAASAAEFSHTTELLLVESEATVIIRSRQEEATNPVDDSLFQDYRDDILESVNISKDDAMSSEDEWNWADEQWQSGATTPQSLDESQIGLCAAEWA